MGTRQGLGEAGKQKEKEHGEYHHDTLAETIGLSTMAVPTQNSGSSN